MNDKLSYWCKRFLTTIPGTYRIPKKKMVTNFYKRHFGFCGYCEADDTLYYDCHLTDEAIVHELLHREFPNLTEKEVRKLTKIIVY